MTTANLWNPPTTEAELAIWGLANRVDHDDIRTGVMHKTSSVSAINLTVAGSGYSSAPSVAIAAPDQSGGTQATATCAIVTSGGSSTLQFTITNPGEGYTHAPAVALSGGGGSGAQAQAVVNYIVLQLYPIDPIPMNDLITWSNAHYQMHTDMLNALGLQSSDMSVPDFQDPVALQDFIFTHIQDHLSARQALGI
jgi:hypothetical protein